MKITKRQLRQLIIESMYSPNEIKINKLVKLINSNEEGLYQALELIKALELEAWNSGNLYSAIKAYSDKWQKEWDAEEAYLTEIWYESGIHQIGSKESEGLGAPWYYYLSGLKNRDGGFWWPRLINDERIDAFRDLGLKIRDLKNFLKKFDTSNMLWIDDPLMENR